MNKKEAIKAIRLMASQDVPPEQQAKFIETIEVELRGLHEGNIARYRLTQPEYNSWAVVWYNL